MHLFRRTLYSCVALAAVDHSTHSLGALPYLVILACPLMHVFMHGSHGGHGHHGQSKPDVSKTAESRKEGDSQ